MAFTFNSIFCVCFAHRFMMRACVHASRKLFWLFSLANRKFIILLCFSIEGCSRFVLVHRTWWNFVHGELHRRRKWFPCIGKFQSNNFDFGSFAHFDFGLLTGSTSADTTTGCFVATTRKIIQVNSDCRWRILDFKNDRKTMKTYNISTTDSNDLYFICM